ncbi:C1q and TNF related 12 [Homo sapiens]|uniref:Adipolin n=2 Tax=Homo sapiens TaxID=9606 RepID=ADIPL_HUMAN|nr:adipolin precursor [Homo sapiens]Q5T7M4.2 RecName: Full=Adipolin; AltName: Full=Adipose-derived insulin-sensitizing factor; AltName: Full=C1q and TNF related protein 12; AltName: Full=Complement C1q tumor necrosis factor-related protein 12; Contains: RecName: Full=Adipolin fC1QTNF12; AltName: Full=Adipolin fCTRP12; AltName: Full=Adipolin full-length form; Contains: RecName: Full=Adipolin gC1QTNF12; AltName: Full=Adipolin cleaved form; AltName: Full=Adipolin gCTRP12; Flags: Precursor [Homo sapie|eukprot:NP_001014980.1 adipolin precursor [Homo sapiens]
MRRWAWAAVVVLLGPQLVLLGGVGARREAQRTQQPGQRADPPNATASASSREGLPEAPKPSQASGPEFSDAHMTWLNFVRRPDDGALRKRCGSRDKKPRDLFGPPGPPGAEVTAETLLHEFQELLKEATERRFSGLLDPLLPQGAGLRLVGEAFHCRLQGPRRVDKRTLVELHGFQAPAAQGAFLRGSGLSLASGRFTAPVSGIFQFSASLHVDHSELQGKARLRARDVVCVLICIESLCQRHTCLEAVSGLESNSRVFTLQVQGLLQLQAGQYASVFVDNGSGAVLTIQAGSSFSGLLLGT